MRLAARRYVETERTWRASVARYEPVYAALAGSRSADALDRAFANASARKNVRP
jgi:hypothetical protein